MRNFYEQRFSKNCQQQSSSINLQNSRLDICPKCSRRSTYNLWYYKISKKYNIILGGKPSGIFSYQLRPGRIAEKSKATLLLSRLNLTDGRFCTEHQKKRTNARRNFYDENLRKSREYSSIIKLEIMHSDKTSI